MTRESTLNSIDRAIACVLILAGTSAALFVLLLVTFLERHPAA